MSRSYHVSSDHAYQACYAFNSLSNNQRTGAILDYFENLFESISWSIYLDGSSIVEQTRELGGARREVVTIDGEKVLKINITGIETIEPFFYYRSLMDCSYYFKENSRTLIELNEKNFTYRIIENANSSVLT
tara:strand:- start:1012 stop:1407 length:396 start_codon:yes stop_codon:yes gene_type:complete